MIDKSITLANACRNNGLHDGNVQVEELDAKKDGTFPDYCKAYESLSFNDAYDRIFNCLKEKANISFDESVYRVEWFDDKLNFDSILVEQQESLKKFSLDKFYLKEFIRKERKKGSIGDIALFRRVLFILLLSKMLNDSGYLDDAIFLLMVVCNHHQLFYGYSIPYTDPKEIKLHIVRSKAAKSRTVKNLDKFQQAICAHMFIYRPDTGWESKDDMARKLKDTLVNFIKDEDLKVVTNTNMTERVDEWTRECNEIANAYALTRSDTTYVKDYNRCAYSFFWDGADSLFIALRKDLYDDDPVQVRDLVDYHTNLVFFKEVSRNSVMVNTLLEGVCDLEWQHSFVHGLVKRPRVRRTENGKKKYD